MSAYAIIEIAGFQYKASKGQEIETQKWDFKKDKAFKVDKVLLIKDGKKVLIGTPFVKGASVLCEVLKEFRGDKTIAYKYKRRKSFHWKKGNRQAMCLLKVKEINASTD